MFKEWPKMLRRINPATNQLEKRVFQTPDDVPANDGWSDDSARILEMAKQLAGKEPLSDAERNQIEILTARLDATERERDAIQAALDASQKMIDALQVQVEELQKLLEIAESESRGDEQ